MNGFHTKKKVKYFLFIKFICIFVKQKINHMPYITKDEVKRKRELLKRMFPTFKLSVTMERHTTINVNILEGPIDMPSYEQVNHYYIKEHYKDRPQVKEVLQEIYDVINSGNGTLVVDSDYGHVPNFYTSITIGKWDKPYKKI